MPPLRILTVGHSYVVAANRSVMARVAADPTVEMTLVAPDFVHGDLRPIPLERAAGEPFELVALPTRLGRKLHLLSYRGLKRACPPGRFDLLHAWEEPFVVAGYQCARLAVSRGLRFTFWTAQNLSKRYPPPFAQFERYCARHADGWLACGQLVLETLRPRGYPDLSVVTGMAIDESRFFPDPGAGDAVRRRLGLEGPVIGYSGRLTAEKGMDVLMAALDRVPGRWSLLMLGKGPYRRRLEDWAASNGWSDRLRILNVAHDEVPDHIRAMDLLVAPSRTMPRWKEQFGRMLTEAFACRVPVLGSDSGEIPHVIGDAGLVLPEDDPGRWAEAIASLLESPDQRRELGEAGLDRCRRHYTSARMAELYLDFFRRVMDRGRAG